MIDNKQHLIKALRTQLAGLKDKITNDFSESNYHKELELLQNDSVYPKFGFDRTEYVLIRLMGRVSISVGRRLGEIYDKVPRILASARYGLDMADVTPVYGGLELDLGLKSELLKTNDKKHLMSVVKKYCDIDINLGIGIEIRYNFNPNDSSRLRKDVNMAELLISEQLLPVYLIFSSISPREDAIARLKRAGWFFLVGEDAINFLRDILGDNFLEILEAPEIKEEINREIDQIMASLLGSYAFKELSKSASFPSIDN
jgi:hypothetical protein